MRFTLPALAAALAFSFATPASAWVQHYYSNYTPPSFADAIRAKRDGLKHSNARLVQAHKDRLNRVLVAMGETSDVGHVVEIHTQGEWQRATSWSSCSEAPTGRSCREVAPSAMSVAEIKSYRDRFNNSLWNRIYTVVTDDLMGEYNLNSWGSWDDLPSSAQTIVDNDTATNVLRYGWGAPDMDTPAEMGLAGATFKGYVDGDLNPKTAQRLWDYIDGISSETLTGHGDTTLVMTISSPHALSADISVHHHVNWERKWKSGNKNHRQTGDYNIEIERWTAVDVNNPGGFTAEGNKAWEMYYPDGSGDKLSAGGGTISGSFYGNGTGAAGDVKTGNIIGTWKAWKVSQ